MLNTVTAIRIDTARSLAAAALERAGTSPENSASLSEALIASERDYIASHCLSRAAVYADLASARKVGAQGPLSVELSLIPICRRPRPRTCRVPMRAYRKRRKS